MRVISATLATLSWDAHPWYLSLLPQHRCLAGEEPLTEDPPEGMFKPVTEPNQLDNMLLSNQMASYCQHVNSATQQALSKLVLMDGLQKAL
jgi:translation initiation factor 3 subunit H